ncbi:DUF3710 domain-containing protein [uncultured Corynebacterium sp.]|uniref:DUF3710 domain-containing protein n=1 Tax=uncultured Corynebacterium sp. TaxID=159447 RepID=UPI0026000037|nr:DUF3710 domain-containing protein [uncultured Corynebacterium sp.]
MWPFGKKKDAAPAEIRQETAQTAETDRTLEATEAATSSPTPASGSEDTTYDPVNGSFGPFDGDSVDYHDFDFSDFAKGGLDLGSMLIPVPHKGEVQVEMGQEGPRQIHILTPFGRITPAAFAAPRSGGQWAGDIDEFAEGMVRDGLEVTRCDNDWGVELVGVVGDGVVRVIGVDGPRWMLRMTLAGPAASADELAETAYEVISRTFVNRGSEPAPAGRSLPVVIPQAMAEELKRTLARQQENRQQQAVQAPRPAPEATSTTAPRPGTARRRTGGTVDRQMGGTE